MNHLKKIPLRMVSLKRVHYKYVVENSKIFFQVAKALQGSQPLQTAKYCSAGGAARLPLTFLTEDERMMKDTGKPLLNFIYFGCS